ncbi:hypothetical protein [Streptomyces sp. NPDC087212]|uniref:hypothetical protein n=1 Tax=Streptomyces sp. NPDC087212 TaxID=3365766 RepID=UPI0037F94E9A
MFGSKRTREPVTGPFYQQRSWVGSALFMAFLLVMALTAAMTNDDGKGLSAESQDALGDVKGPLSPGDPQGVRTGRGGRPENCRTDDRDTTVPTAAPQGIQWKQFDAVMLPVSPVAGPLNIDPSMWWCFGHTPLGAVLAATVIPVSASSDGWRTVTAQQLVPGTARDRYVTRKLAAPSTNPAESAVGRFVGFSVAHYQSGAATVRLLLTNPAGGYMAATTNLRWRDGDWKLAPQDSGSLYSATAQAQPDGFVLWGA